jgi:type I restriction enzyme M protein
MGFLDDAPRSVNGMVCVMRDLGQYRYDVGDVFKDFVDYAVACFSYHGDQVLADQLKAKYGNDYQKLNEMLVAWIRIMDERITNDVLWFDALGTLYEYLASRSKKSWLGQFFTPPDLCDLMTQISSPLPLSSQERGKRVNDCACGSGRTLLSFNAHHPGNMLYGEDLDPICAKMTALNMAIHGCQGQATCMDSLCQDWKFCFEVNPYHRLGSPPIPHLVPVTMEKCFAKLQVVVSKKEPDHVHDKPVVNMPKKPVFVAPGQLSLF